MTQPGASHAGLRGTLASVTAATDYGSTLRPPTHLRIISPTLVISSDIDVALDDLAEQLYGRARANVWIDELVAARRSRLVFR